MLHFPIGAAEALASGTINLHEATLLARLTAERLGCSPAKAKSIRSEVLRAHITAQGSQNGLRARVKEILGEASTVSSENMTAIVQKVDELLEVDPADKRHIFYEEMKRLFYAMREIQPEDVDDNLEEFIRPADGLSNTIYAIELKRQKREQKVKKLNI